MFTDEWALVACHVFAMGFYLLLSLLASWGDGGGSQAFEEGG